MKDFILGRFIGFENSNQHSEFYPVLPQNPPKLETLRTVYRLASIPNGAIQTDWPRYRRYAPNFIHQKFASLFTSGLDYNLAAAAPFRGFPETPHTAPGVMIISA